MRITEAARRLGTSPRMLRYRDALGLLPRVRAGAAAGHRHRQFGPDELDAVTAGLAIEQRYDISPAALAFGLRVLADPAVRAAVADFGRRLGRLPSPAERALAFEQERALRLLGDQPSGRARRPGPAAGPGLRAARMAGSVASASADRYTSGSR